MIKTVLLENFESHKKTLLDFSNGLNVLTGSSSAGKSSIRRAISWVVENRPNGSSMISWDNLDKKKKQIDPTRVVVTLLDGTTIERVKSSTLNGYIINSGKPLEAVGTSVPTEVSTIFNFSDVNIQAQLDGHFLISESAGEVARYLNGVVSLEDADVYQAAIESKRRKCNTEITLTSKAVETLEKDISQFNWIPKAEKLISKIEKQEKVKAGLDTELYSLRSSIDGYDREKDRLELCGVVPKAEAIVSNINKLLLSKEQIHNTVSAIEREVERYKRSLIDTGYTDVLSKSSKLYAKIARLNGIKCDILKEISVLRDSVTNYSTQADSVKTIQRELNPLVSELSLIDICPLCHQKLKNTEVSF